MLCEICNEKLRWGKGENCVICCNFFDRADDLAFEIFKNLDFEFNSFNVAIRNEGSFRALQEFFEGKFDYDLKIEIKRVLQKKIGDLTQREISHEPDVLITFSPEDFTFRVEIKPLFLYGRYIKRVRNISQTRWLCGFCKGFGCEICNFSGKRFATSVEELISIPVIRLFNAKNALLHGAGREDVDARMLGNGRPFVLEIVEPKKRKLDIFEVERAINEFCGGRVEVKSLRFATLRDVEIVKKERFRKIYRAKVVFDRIISREELEIALKRIVGEIKQRTPKRVLHRRADVFRLRKVYRAEILEHFGKIAVLKFETDAGLYVKELVSGDEGRTEPNLSKKFKAYVEKLDVLEVIEN
ncbi:MAG: tRNA pseudouridine(54/55) synthase Pus10 [Archaeoglobaceae archaeon]|nr:tRNA pseudouridine(54/55) synthase Pus10 [Archaeoglobaceae archaeon]MDW7989847.1 tRNA pseudouridine(54/55) synthase Pus10 [Archaeoglobaceae archaeon]